MLDLNIMHAMSRTTVACLFAWLIPGGGHLFLKKRARAAVFFTVVTALFAFGLYMDGKLFSLESGFFGLLRFVADAAVGLPYILGKLLGWGQGNIRSFGYEYGNTYLYTAGLVNMLLILDTYDIARGRKQ
jgi:hypothetical protein